MNIKRAYRRNTHKNLFSFGDTIRKVPVSGMTLEAWQENAIQKAGLTLVDIDDITQIPDEHFFLFDDHLFFTSAFVKSALILAQMRNVTLQFGLENNRFNQRFILPSATDVTQYLIFPFYGIMRGQLESKLVLVPQRTFENSIKIPSQVIRDGQYYFDQCDTLITEIISPFHLLYANLYTLFLRVMALRKWIPDSMIEKLVASRSRRLNRLFKMKNKIGKHCDIHPTAILEGVEIGDHVTIGAYTVVRMAKIGSNTTLEDQSSAIYSILGKNNYIYNRNHIRACLTYDDVFLSYGPYQWSIFGKGSASFAILSQGYSLDQQNIRIPTEIGMIDSGQQILGAAYGHYSKIGDGNILTPGQIIPNGCLLKSIEQEHHNRNFPYGKGAGANNDVM